MRDGVIAAQFHDGKAAVEDDCFSLYHCLGLRNGGEVYGVRLNRIVCVGREKLESHFVMYSEWMMSCSYSV